MLLSLVLTCSAVLTGLGSDSQAVPAGVDEGARTPPRAASPRGAPSEPLDDTWEVVRLKASDRSHTAASYFKPKIRSGRAPGVVLIHAAGSDRASLDPLAAYLQRKGMGVISVDLRGHGDSATEQTSWARLDAKAKVVTWAQARRDVEAATHWLRGRKEIHSTRLALVGVGSGCTLAVRHGRDDSNVRAVALLDPPVSFMGLEMAKAVGDLDGLATLILATAKSREQCEKICTSAVQANDGYEFVSVQVLQAEPGKLLSDRRLNNNTYLWLREYLSPEKGK